MASDLFSTGNQLIYASFESTKLAVPSHIFLILLCFHTSDFLCDVHGGTKSNLSAYVHNWAILNHISKMSKATRTQFVRAILLGM